MLTSSSETRHKMSNGPKAEIPGNIINKWQFGGIAGLTYVSDVENQSSVVIKWSSASTFLRSRTAGSLLSAGL